MADRNAAASAGTTRVTLAYDAANDAQGGRLLRAVQEAVAGEFEVFGELGRGRDGVVVYLARELATRHLVALRFTPGDRTTRDAGEMWLEVVRRLDETVPAADASCPRCGKPLPGWGRFCSQCGADLSGLAASAAPGGTPDELMRAVREAARGRFEVLGEMSRVEGGGTVYFAKDLRSGRVTALRLTKQTDPAGQTAQYRLGQTHVLRSVADLVGDGGAAPAPPRPEIQLETQLREAGAPPTPPPPPTRPPVSGPGRAPLVAGGLAAVTLLALAVAMSRERAVDDTAPAPPDQVLAESVAAELAIRGGSAGTADGATTTGDTLAEGPGVPVPGGAAPGGTRTPTCSALFARRAFARALPVCEREAAGRGGTAAQRAAGTMYERGLGTAPDPARAAAWYGRAAAGADPVSQFRLGVLLRDGRGVRRDEQAAAAWFRRAADRGNAGAQEALGAAYEAGRGVGADGREAVAWYLKAAAGGAVGAQVRLADLYERGGDARFDAEAVRWLRSAAERGDAGAQFRLGRRHAEGRGVARSESDAVAWFTRAAAGGHSGARAELRRRGR
jgi:hypothetical protein